MVKLHPWLINTPGPLSIRFNPIAMIKKPQTNHLPALLLVVVAVSVAVSVAVGTPAARNASGTDGSAGSHVAAVSTAVPFDTAAFLKPHLDTATTRTDQAVELRIAEVRSFFSQAQQRTSGFAETALGWSSKWAMMVDALPFNGSGRQDAFLRAEFERQVFGSNDLTKAIQQAAAGFAADLASIENRMLVDIRADLSAKGIDSAIHGLDDNQLRETFHLMLATCRQAAATDVADDVAIFVTAVLVERIIAKALFGAVRKTGASAAVLGAGAATSWASLGTSMIVAVVVDQILSKIWDWAFDPVGHLQANLNEYLQSLGDAICEGNEDAGGLRSQLQQFAAERAHYRQQSLEIMLGEETQ